YDSPVPCSQLSSRHSSSAASALPALTVTAIPAALIVFATLTVFSAFPAFTAVSPALPYPLPSWTSSWQTAQRYVPRHILTRSLRPHAPEAFYKSRFPESQTADWSEIPGKMSAPFRAEEPSAFPPSGSHSG